MSGEATIYDVADVAGVSAATVSRVLKGSSLIGEEARRRVLQAARKLCYEPRRVRRQRERGILTVKLVLPRHESGLKRLFYDFSELADGLREGLAPCEVNLLTDVTRRGFDPFPNKKGGEIDAFVFAFQRPAERVVREIRERGAELVVLNRSMSGVPSLASDNAKGMRLLAAHLAERGVRDGVAFLGYEGIADVMEERLEGFARGTAELGIDFDRGRDLHLIPAPEDLRREEVEELLKTATTLVCVNDVLAAVVMPLLQELQMAVPEQVRVTGFDDSPIRALVRPALTTVSLPVADLARRAGEQLQRSLVDQQAMPRERRLQGCLLVGEST